MHQDLYDKAKKILRKDTCMKLSDASRPIYQEIDASGLSLKVGILQARDSMNHGYDKIPDNVTLYPTAFAPAKAYRVWSGYSAILNGYLFGYYMVWKSFTITILPKKYVLSQAIINWWQ